MPEIDWNAQVRVNDVSTRFYASCIAHTDDEIRQMENAVPLLSKEARHRIENAYEEGERWRGLASPEFIAMVDMLAIMIERDVIMKDGVPVFAALANPPATSQENLT